MFTSVPKWKLIFITNWKTLIGQAPESHGPLNSLSFLSLFQHLKAKESHSPMISSVAQTSDSVTPWIAAHQASLSITNSWSLLKLMPIESVTPSSHLILFHPLLILPPIPPSIMVFSNESTLRIRWPKDWFQLQHQSFQWTPRTDLL